jgi:hypothetical protein
MAAVGLVARTGIVAARARAVFSIVLSRQSYREVIARLSRGYRLRNAIMHSKARAVVNLYTF